MALSENVNMVAMIYLCLDGTAFYSMTDDSIIPARRIAGTDNYHIDGALVIAPSDVFTKSIKMNIPLFSVPTDAKKIVLSPLPRYW
jgi:hypothetical protein